MPTLEFLSVDFWQTIMAIGNLLILFLIVKKFLFKPINDILNKRAQEVDKIYSEAEELRTKAKENKDIYEDKLKNAKAETDLMIKSATERANHRGEEIIKHLLKQKIVNEKQNLISLLQRKKP
jgi:F-type H+-transporting ATPase subunit b